MRQLCYYDIRSSKIKEGNKYLNATALAKKAVEVASDKQAADIVLLDLSQVCPFTDYFVICNGESERQIESLRDSIDEALGKEGISVKHREGTADSGWVLLDFGSIIVHIFAPQERAYYQLDRLWSKAPAVLRIQ
ncbi:MAG: ribosome silencing factor [Chloroflexi bacterium]|nr:ribosome silencing factor [Chloroflexota bacterium]